MKIALIGYGKMGKEIEQVALSRGHEICLKLDSHNAQHVSITELEKADVAIEFTAPSVAVNNIYKCFQARVPVVCGTTGWLTRYEEVKQQCIESENTFFYASNYSLGVNLFFQLSQKLAQLMRPHKGYDVEMTEIHHTQKLDAPSGTAITLAQGIIDSGIKQSWYCAEHPEHSQQKPETSAIVIKALREEHVPGTHLISYTSEEDQIEIKHTAFSRKGFALGAVVAAEWLKDKTGVYGMNELLGF